MNIVPYEERHVEAVRQFNRRLKAGGSLWRFTETPVPQWLPGNNGQAIYQQYYLALDDDGSVRGGYALKHQEFLVRGQRMQVGVCRMPISEAIVAPRHAMVGVLLVRDALRRQPYLYALGLGGMEHSYARLLHAFKWQIHLVPFYFRVADVGAFLANMPRTEAPRYLKLLCRDLAFSRVGPPLIHGCQGVLGIRSRLARTVTYEEVDSFGSWTDSLWEGAKGAYSMVAVRDAPSLNLLYPAQNPAHRIRVKVRGKDAGWAVVLSTQMKESPYFWNMKVGSIVDVLARPGQEPSVVKASLEYLFLQDIDLIVSNQNHRLWLRALASAGFLRGPSNYAFGVSTALERLLDPLHQSIRTIHLTRGDGDGPINL